MHTRFSRTFFASSIDDLTTLRSFSGTVNILEQILSLKLAIYYSQYAETRHLTIETGGSPIIVAARTAARSLLFAHLLKLEIPVHVFENSSDDSWIQYISERKVLSTHLSNLFSLQVLSANVCYDKRWGGLSTRSNC